MLRNIVSIVLLFSSSLPVHRHAILHIHMSVRLVFGWNEKNWDAECWNVRKMHWGRGREWDWNNACGWICSMCSSDMHTSANRRTERSVFDKMAQKLKCLPSNKRENRMNTLYSSRSMHTHIYSANAIKFSANNFGANRFSWLGSSSLRLKDSLNANGECAVRWVKRLCGLG